MKIEELNLSNRSYNALKRAQIDTVGQLAAMSDEDLLKVWYIGKGSLKEIRQSISLIMERGFDNGK